MNAEALHGGVTAWNRPVGHLPHEHVRGLGHEGHKIPKGIVCAGSLRHLVVWLRLDSMDEIGKLDGVLNEKHRHVVAHQIPVALVGVELDGKTTHITGSIF